MRDRTKLALGIFSFFYLSSSLHRLVFALDNFHKSKALGENLWWLILHWSLPADLVLASALSVLPISLILLQFFCLKTDRLIKIYMAIALTCLTIVNTVDLLIYQFWGRRCDLETFSALKQPWTILANFSGSLAVEILVRLIPECLILFIALRLTIFRKLRGLGSLDRRELIVFLPICAFLCFFSASGIQPNSNENLNHAFFADENQARDLPFAMQVLENPARTVLYQALPTIHETPPCLYPEGTPEYRAPEPQPRERVTLLRQGIDRPNIIIVVESFSSDVIGILDGDDKNGLTPRFDALSEEGILFTNFYANTAWTVGAIRSIVSAMPINIDPKHSPSLVGPLIKKGYSTFFYYGGDPSFSGMGEYLRKSDFRRFFVGPNFPSDLPHNSWGTHDHAFFSAVADDLEKEGSEHQPVFSLLLTLSNHAPFDVPNEFIFHMNQKMAAIDEKAARSIAYTDDSFGKFIDQLKRSPLWENTLVIFMADHGRHESPYDARDPRRYKIPMLWLGGAIEKPQRIEQLGAQSDLAATLLGQLGLDADEFRFSRDILHSSENFSFYHDSSGNFGVIQGGDAEIFSCTEGTSLRIHGDTSLTAFGWSYVRSLLKYQKELESE